MTSESATSPAIPPPQVDQPLPQQNSVNSEPISAGPPSPPPQVTMEDIVNSNGILTDQLIDEEPSYYKYLDSEEYADKYRRYEADFKQYLVDKYFSGVDSYEERATIDDETIMFSKWPCTRSYADRDNSYVGPVQCLVEEEVAVEAEEAEEAEEAVEAEEVEEVEEVVAEEAEEVEEKEESVDSAAAEIPNGEISNGGTVLEDSCDVGKKPDMPI